MEIIKQSTPTGLELTVSGRLDAYWADHLSKALEEAVRDGAHHIRVNMAAVPYMSSVGIRVLLKFYKELQRLNGSFAVSNPSDAVKTVLDLAGLEVLLSGQAVKAETGAPVTSMISTLRPSIRPPPARIMRMIFWAVPSGYSERTFVPTTSLECLP